MSIIYSAPFVLTLNNGILQEGSVEVVENRIAEVGRRSSLRRKYPRVREIYFERCVLMPGLINAHTHLEDGLFRGTLPAAGDRHAWALSVRVQKDEKGIEPFVNEVHLGALELLNRGVTSVMDSSLTGAAFRVLQNEKIRSVVFLECAGPDPSGDSLDAALSRADGFMANDRAGWGISPFAPPGLDAGTFLRCLKYAEDQKVMITVHPAGPEPAEGGEPDREEGWVTQLIDRRLLRRGMLLVHGYRVHEREITALARMDASVVLCPSAELKARPGALPVVPVFKYLAKKVNLCLGTESPALSESLDLFEEMYLLKRLHPALKSETILETAACGGARAMGMGGLLGRVRPGFLADLVAVEVAHSPACDLHDELVLEDHAVRFVLVDGREVLV